MSQDVVVPLLGESITEAQVSRWLKKAGDRVAADETLIELETDKITVEVHAPVSGIIESIRSAEGSVVRPGEVLGTISESAERTTSTSSATHPLKQSASTPSSETMRSDDQPFHGPAVEKLAKEMGIDLSTVKGSGKQGRVTKVDLTQLQQVKDATSISPNRSDQSSSEEHRVPLSRLRKTIAQRLKDAQNTAAMLTTFNDVDLSKVMDLRATYKDLFEKRFGVKLGFMGMFTRAVCSALRDIPSINAEIQGDELVYKNYCNIGVAVGTEKGLVVPVVRNAEQLTIQEIELTIAAFAKKAREGRLSLEDMRGGTFTITNGGVYGSLLSTPILNAPQSGILGMHRIEDRPVVINKQIEIRPMMYLALTYDHRIVDGKEAVTFLVRVKDLLENPERMILDL